VCVFYLMYKVGDVTAVRVFHPRGTAGAWREGALRGRDVGGGRDGQMSGERPAKRQRTEGDGVRIDPKYKFVRFTLFKENRDTMGGISELCRFTSLAPKKFSYAGTKDRRACTAQYVTVARADSRHLVQVNRKIRFGLVLGNFVYCQEALRLGDLYGNRFELVLRDVDAQQEHLKEACDSLAARGFINYFGLQRFGTSAVPTHVIGRALLQVAY
jgi:TruD family tRNA pseudouridine synthase